MKRVAMVVALLPLVSGCPKPAVRPYPPPSADELMAALRSRAEHLKTLRMTAKVDHMANGGERVRIKVNMLL
ncbi:MAG: hypothetical protein ACXVAN_16710, partial [Polyangia bacterium]